MNVLILLEMKNSRSMRKIKKKVLREGYMEIGAISHLWHFVSLINKYKLGRVSGVCFSLL